MPDENVTRARIAQNENLTRAREGQNDEFYTQFEDIEKEVNAYLELNPDVFRGKTILLPCDDPEWSNFTKFFALNFEYFGLKKLISTCYAMEGATPTQPITFVTKPPHYNVEKSKKHGKILVIEGNDDAQNTVGKIYLNADYVKHDNKKAFKNFQLAAAQGHIEAMAYLGYCYQEGIGTDINIQSAEEWLKKAADGGFADAQNALGNLYLEIIQDNHKAYKYYQMAAAQRHAYGMLNLGLCYLNGNGVEASFKTADEWIRKAADAGVPEAIDIINSKTPNAKFQNLPLSKKIEVENSE